MLTAVPLLPPVPGPVARPFAYVRAAPFRAGQHRGIDLAARPGTPVRAACTGTVAWAAGSVVTLRCGPWRVSVLPVTPQIPPGTRVTAGTRLGTLTSAPDHHGLHLGVRREADRFAYVDPTPHLTHHPTPPTLTPRRPATPHGPATPRAAAPRPAPPDRSAARDGRVPRAAAPRSAPPDRSAAPHGRVPRAAAPRSAPPDRSATPDGPALHAASSHPATPRSSLSVGADMRVAASRRTPRAVEAAAREVRVPGRALAPWPAWLGLLVLALGAAGGGVRAAVNRRRIAAAVPEAA